MLGTWNANLVVSILRLPSNSEPEITQHLSLNLEAPNPVPQDPKSLNPKLCSLHRSSGQVADSVSDLAPNFHTHLLPRDEGWQGLFYPQTLNPRYSSGRRASRSRWLEYKRSRVEDAGVQD